MSPALPGFFCGRAQDEEPRLLLRDSACIARALDDELLIRGSSVVEQPAVNRLVVGSNPTRGATQR
jgi:hypothetical protein